jgi:hypothetical protein
LAAAAHAMLRHPQMVKIFHYKTDEPVDMR